MRKNRREEEETSYWLSYSDMMAALLLIFVLIISFTMLQAKKQYEDKEKELAEQQGIIKKQQEQIDQLVGIKIELIETLKDEFKNTDLSVSVDSKTGAIALDSSILFDFDDDKLKKSGENFLKKFIPKYLKVLTNKKFKDYVSEIIIEGHTDTKGDYIYNLELSQKRALSVASFCLDSKKKVVSKKEIKSLRKIVTANGKSFSNPIINSKGKEDKEASRRVEFKFRLEDDKMIEEMSNILKE